MENENRTRHAISGEEKKNGHFKIPEGEQFRQKKKRKERTKTREKKGERIFCNVFS